MRLTAEELRQEVRGEERDPESQSSAVTITTVVECFWLVTGFQHFCLETNLAHTVFSLITESDKASVRGRMASCVVMA